MWQDVDNVKLESEAMTTPTDSTSSATTGTPPVRSDEYHHGDLANALLAATDEIIRERGVPGLSMREAARRAGVSHSAPAHHFGDKNGMLAAFAQEGFTGLGEEMVRTEAEAANADELEQMSAIGTAYVRFATEHPAHFDVMFRSSVDKQADPALHDAADAAYGMLLAKVRELQAAGIYAGVDERYLAAYFWSIVHGMASLWVDGTLPHFFEDHTLDELITGVLAVPGVAPNAQAGATDDT